MYLELLSTYIEPAFEQLLDELDREATLNAPYYQAEFAARRGAFERALAFWRAGKRPLLLNDGSWIVPSESGLAIVHVIRKDGYFWRCGTTCPCRRQFHKHGALMLAIERAGELAETEAMV